MTGKDLRLIEGDSEPVATPLKDHGSERMPTEFERGEAITSPSVLQEIFPYG